MAEKQNGRVSSVAKALWRIEEQERGERVEKTNLV
jgi:hypothetical protein